MKSNIQTQRFSSPNSSLPPKALEQLQACMRINDLLRSFGNPRDPENLTGLRMHFEKLRGVLMRIEVACEDEKKIVLGTLELAGRDFLMLRNIEDIFLIPYTRICFIHSSPMDHLPKKHEPEPLSIDPCLKSQIVLNFGEVVSQDSRLINIFFGIPLHLQLVTFLECKIKVILEEGEMEGVLIEVCQEAIHLQKDGEKRKIDLEEICLINI